MTSFLLLFVLVNALGAAVFYMFMDAWPASIETWGVVVLLGVFLWGLLRITEKIFMVITDFFLPRAGYTSDALEKELDPPLSGVVFTSKVFFTMLRTLAVVVILVLVVTWLSRTVTLPEGYQIRYFLKKEWRLEIR